MPAYRGSKRQRQYDVAIHAQQHDIQTGIHTNVLQGWENQSSISYPSVLFSRWQQAEKERRYQYWVMQGAYATFFPEPVPPEDLPPGIQTLVLPTVVKQRLHQYWLHSQQLEEPFAPGVQMLEMPVVEKRRATIDWVTLPQIEPPIEPIPEGRQTLELPVVQVRRLHQYWIEEMQQEYPHPISRVIDQLPTVEPRRLHQSWEWWHQIESPTPIARVVDQLPPAPVRRSRVPPDWILRGPLLVPITPIVQPQITDVPRGYDRRVRSVQGWILEWLRITIAPPVFNMVPSIIEAGYDPILYIMAHFEPTIFMDGHYEEEP